MHKKNYGMWEVVSADPNEPKQLFAGSCIAAARKAFIIIYCRRNGILPDEIVIINLKKEGTTQPIYTFECVKRRLSEPTIIMVDGREIRYEFSYHAREIFSGSSIKL